MLDLREKRFKELSELYLKYVKADFDVKKLLKSCEELKIRNDQLGEKIKFLENGGSL